MVTDLNAPHALRFFTSRLDIMKSNKLMKDIMFNPPKDLSKAYNRAENFITIKEAIGSLKLQMGMIDKPKDQDMSYNPRSETQPMKKFNGGNLGSGQPLFPNQNVNKVYTPLNTDRARILEEVRDKPYFELCPTVTYPQRGRSEAVL